MCLRWCGDLVDDFNQWSELLERIRYLTEDAIDSVDDGDIVPVDFALERPVGDEGAPFGVGQRRQQRLQLVVRLAEDGFGRQLVANDVMRLVVEAGGQQRVGLETRREGVHGAHGPTAFDPLGRHGQLLRQEEFGRTAALQLQVSVDDVLHQRLDHGRWRAEVQQDEDGPLPEAAVLQLGREGGRQLGAGRLRQVAVAERGQLLP